MDETLISSGFAWAEAPGRLLRSMGIVQEEDIAGMFYETGFTKLIAHLQGHYQLPFSETELFAKLSGYATEDYRDKVTVKAGAGECIGRMKREGYFTCLLTANNPDLVDIIRSRFKDTLPLDAWFSTKRLGYPKSDCRIYDLVSGYFGMTPVDCILFDDAQYAVEAAYRSGIKVIRIVDRASEQDGPYPYRCVRTLQEFVTISEEAAG